MTLTSQDPARLAVDALVVAVAQQDDAPVVLGAEHLPKELRTLLASSATALGITGAADEVRRLPGTGLAAAVLVLTGVGSGPLTPESLRRAAGAATRELAGTASVGLALPADDAESVSAVAEGALLGAYSFARYNASTKAPVATIQIVTKHPRDRAAKDGRRPRVGGRRRGAPHPRPGEHRAERPLPGRVRGPRQGRRQGLRRQGPARDGDRRQGAARGRLRRADRRRAGLVARTAPGQGRLLAVARPRARSRSSARASRSTRAASRSSPPRAWRR